MIKIQLNRSFVTKMAEAKRLEREALISLLPEPVRNHVIAIEKEMTAMVAECLLEGFTSGGRTGPNASVKNKHGVRKVTID